MKPVVILLGLVLLLDAAFGAEETCAGRCGTFDPLRKCQCDPMCVYYTSCCDDYDQICPKKTTRGDTFAETEDETTPVTPLYTTSATDVTDSDTVTETPQATSPAALLPPADLDAAACSGRPFDAFLQLKNGSTYAFRGKYFFELDDTEVLPGYPKLIEDVWGISGPIDAAFTRINCQGKSYIFKGHMYWRFDGDVMDKDYPRNISDGFDNIPDDLDAAFAVPAPSHRGRENAYFFKGDKYYKYEFRLQPSHEECVRISESSPSLLFKQFTNLFCDRTWEDIFMELFGDSVTPHRTVPRLISRDWRGIVPPVDAAMVGRVHLSPKPTRPPSLAARRESRKKRKSSKRKRGKKSHPVIYDEMWDLSDLFDFSDYDDYSDYGYIAPQSHRSTPIQNVYFFQKDKYFRADLQTKRVASVNPPYPRSIAKYWLGCKNEETPDVLKEKE